MIRFFSFLDGCGIALSDPAWRASIGDMLEPVISQQLSRSSISASTPFEALVPPLAVQSSPSLGRSSYSCSAPLIYGARDHFMRNNWKVQTSSLPREALMTAIYDGLRFTAISAEIKNTIIRGTLFGFSSISNQPSCAERNAGPFDWPCGG
ncbi:MFS transporter [Pararhizobium sp. YC-54]|uniref:MFS transporter n=1 Tax=Pararhizobium sp. YC-54 TaxID=2986920 RepID=UPI0021F70D02|nr:MFS transporter [Pararhizobium sp. YC-54]MCW0001586.1 MFS transporter [Pararhizobium sp. YC-54]